MTKMTAYGKKDSTKNCQTYPELNWLYALGKHIGLDIFHFIKVVIIVLRLSSIELSEIISQIPAQFPALVIFYMAPQSPKCPTPNKT